MSELHTAKNQRILSQFVDREVIHCCSTMVYELSKQGSYMDNLYDLLTRDNWQTPVTEHEDYIAGDEDVITVRDIDGENCDCESWQEAAKVLGIDDPETIEAYEHWIVSPWLAEKLAAEGEIVGELFDFHIWGRACTGQAIMLDSVIGRIASDMGILEGQPSEWAA